MPGRSGDRNSPMYGSLNSPAGEWFTGISSCGTRLLAVFRTRTARAGGRTGILEWTLLSVPPDISRSMRLKARTKWIWARRIRRAFALPDTGVSQVSQEASSVGRCAQCGSGRLRRRLRGLGGSKAGFCVWIPASFFGLHGNGHGIIWREAGSASYLLNEPGQTRRLLVPMSSFGALSLDVGKTGKGG